MNGTSSRRGKKVDGDDNLNEINKIKKKSSVKSKLNFKNLRENVENLKKKNENEDVDDNNQPLIKKTRKNKHLNSINDNDYKQLEDPPKTAVEKKLCINRLKFDFFNTPCEQLAQNLLGKILVRKLDNGIILKGRIVETESYLGIIDKASQSYQNKITPRTLPMFMPAGTIYVYLTYGMYHCFNISSEEVGAAVLLRALEPIEGIEEMIARRILENKSKKVDKNKVLKNHEICNGPSKLCMALNITRKNCKYSICSWKGMWIEDDSNPPPKDQIKIIKCPRIGIDSAGPEWANKPLRYYIYGNSSVSKRNKKYETQSIN